MTIRSTPPYRVLIDGDSECLAGPFSSTGMAVTEALRLVRGGSPRLVVLDALDTVCDEVWPCSPSLGGAAFGHHHPRPDYRPNAQRVAR